MVKFWIAAAVFWALSAVPMAADYLEDPALVTVATRAMILGVAALSLAFLLRPCGLLSLGHAAFIGIGAYAAAICVRAGLGELLIVLPLAMLAGAVFAGITGAVSC